MVAFGLLGQSKAGLGRRSAFVLVSLPVLFAAAALNSANPMAAILGRWPRYEGLPVLILYVGLVIVGSRMLGGRATGQNRNFLLNGTSLSIIVLAPIAVLESLGLRPLGGDGDIRPGATMGNATDLGLVGLVIFLLLLPQALWTKNRLVQCGALSAGLVTVTSGSRACILVMVVVGLLMVGFRGYRQAKGRRPVLAVVVTVLGFIGGVAALVWLMPAVSERLLSPGTVSGRLYLWDASLKILLQGNFFGIGGSQFVDVLPLHLSDEFARNVGTEFPADSPHMLPLQLLSAGGILLLIAFSALVCAVIVMAIGRIRTTTSSEQRLFLIGALAALSGYGLALLTHFTSPGTMALVCVLAGAVLGTDTARDETAPASQKKPMSVTFRRSMAGLALVGASLGGAAAIAEVPMKSGTDLSAGGNVPQATKAFEAAKALRPWDMDIDLLAAQAFAKQAVQGNGPAAVATRSWAGSATERNPSSAETLTALAVGQLGTGDLPAARQTLDNLIERSPWTSEPYLLRGLAKASDQDLAGAIADVEHAAALTPKPGRALQLLSALYIEAGEPGKAAEVEAQLGRLP
ncbi:O-antigen ligase family protein [Paenarthrobacter nicotinovorans]|uniref:O-antigen ligase family protein n=1 Tax=Paenarthrobacter nicotinovorans TaxID=29320 RepID=UPI00381A928B